MRPTTLAEPGTPAFLGVRQRHVDVDVRVAVRADLAAGEDAGLVVRQSEADHVRVFVTGASGDPGHRAVAVHRQGGVDRTLGELSLGGDATAPVTLAVGARGQDYALLAGTPAGSSRPWPSPTAVEVGPFEYLPV